MEYAQIRPPRYIGIPLLKPFKVIYLNEFFKGSEWSQTAKERSFDYFRLIRKSIIIYSPSLVFV